jgi:hypothetical protein
VEKMITNVSQEKAAESLSELFRFYGSDKSTTHNYHLVYGALLPFLGPCPKILEIGLGSNNPNIVSTMGSHGMPGASLRAFMKFLPNSCVHGADIDTTIKVDGAEIFYLDQCNLESFEKIRKLGELNYDLIIDDGMHTADTSLNTLNFAIGALSKGGIIVIEDINEKNLPIWEVVCEILRESIFNSILIKTRAAYVFVCYRKSAYNF